MNKYWAGTPNYTSGNDGIMYLFPHWTAGGFDASVSTLRNPSREASAHYVIEGDKVAQLVKEGDTAWHCGNWYYNRRSIAYELVGWPGNPPSRKTLDTCAQLMADASRKYFGGAKLVHGVNVKLHREVYATSCPGETDVNYLIAKANEILGKGGSASYSKPSTSTATTSKSTSGVPDIRLQAQTVDGTVLPWTKYPDFAGWRPNGAIAYLCVDCDWPIDVEAYADGRWCGCLRNPNNIKDKVNGCVGNGEPITGLKMYLHSPNGDKVVNYQVAVKNGYYDIQRDTETSNGQDGFAGDLKNPIYEVKAHIGNY